LLAVNVARRPDGGMKTATVTAVEKNTALSTCTVHLGMTGITNIWVSVTLPAQLPKPKKL
jgi:hypothetical protein